MHDHERGFTLLEVLIAITILATAMLSVFAIYTHCILELRRARNRTIASNCAQQMMELIGSTPDDVFHYHGLQTTAALPADHPARADLLTWQATLQRMLPDASGEIAVRDDSIPYITQVTVIIRYRNSGRPTTTVLTLKLPVSFP